MLKSRTPERGRKGEQTRERLLGAAIAEFKRDGMAAADIGAIVSAAGVAHGTFFFHFPTKEHVLVELENREQDRMAAELARFYRRPHDVRATLAKAVSILEALELRLGSRLFKDFLALHFSTRRPPSEEWTVHPVIVAFIQELQRAQDRGEIPADVDVMLRGVSFLAGLYALLITLPESKEIRAPVLDEYVTTYLDALHAV